MKIFIRFIFILIAMVLGFKVGIRYASETTTKVTNDNVVKVSLSGNQIDHVYIAKNNVDNFTCIVITDENENKYHFEINDESKIKTEEINQ